MMTDMNKKNYTLVALSVLGVLVLTGCQNSGAQSTTSQQDLTASASETVVAESAAMKMDPTKVAQMVDSTILAPEGLSLAKDNIRYKVGMADLNDNGSQEIMVVMQDPYFCGSGGCTAYLFDESGKTITRMTVVKTPVLLAESSHNGWKDFVVWSNRAYRVMKFDGNSYPSNPSTEPTIERDSEQKSAMAKVMATELYQQDGYELMPLESDTLLEPFHRYHFTFKHYGDPDNRYVATVDMKSDTLNVDMVPLNE